MKILLLLASAIAVGNAVVISRNGNSVFGVSGKTKGFELREVTLDDRSNCTAGEPDGQQPDNRVDTTQQVNDLIGMMTTRAYDGYVVVSGDAHQSEFTDDCDKRRGYISGLSGSAGTAVILVNGKRALWTDGRYFIQAENQLDCHWLLMKEGEDGVPTVAEWINQEMSPESVVSADARMVSADDWLELEAAVTDAGISLTPDQITDGSSALDEIWNNDGRPACLENSLFVHPVKYAGVSWQDKIADLNDEMNSYGAVAYVMTKLDETAWTLNIRGSDIPYNPVFPSYILLEVDSQGSQVTLFIKNYTEKAVDVMDHLGVNNCTATVCVTLAEYDTIESALTTLNDGVSDSQVLMPYGLSYYVYNLIDTSKHLDMTSPVMLKKASKNAAESAAMRNAHLKDAVALMSFLQFFEVEIKQGNYWTEVSAYKELDSRRALQAEFLSLSFDTISAYGSNGAIIHYISSDSTDKQIGNDSLLMLDSGGTYMDGTTDVTRTLYYGDNPDPKMKEAYTRVLIGQIEFASMIFPAGTYKNNIDIVAREPLYTVGWDYRHGTSHGVGICGLVHEDSSSRFELGFFGSDEPGYYEEGEFGVRLENLVTTVEYTTTYDFVTESYAFDTVTLVPHEPILIDYSMLSLEQCTWLNAFNQMIRDKTTAELQSQGMTDTVDWMMVKTASIACS